MKDREARDRGGLLTRARVVLHRAGPKGIEGRVYPPLLAGEVGVVTDDRGLVYLGELRLLFTLCFLRQHLVEVRLLHVELREGVASAALAPFVPDQVKRHSTPPPRRHPALSWPASPSP